MSHQIILDRNNELIEATQVGTRRIEFCGFDLIVENDVFPPDLGLASIGLVNFLKKQKSQNALDVGTGSLLLALTLRRYVCEDVWAIDIHDPAIECAKKNLTLNSQYGHIQILKSDLFAEIPDNKKFELIVFNQPFYPISGSPIAGMGTDGGYEIIKRFLQQAQNYLTRDGKIIMPYYEPLATEKHSPLIASVELNYDYELVECYGEYNQGHIYQFKMKI